MNHLKRTRLCLTYLLFFITVGSATSCSRFQSLNISVICDSAEGLATDAPVTTKGLEIGKVKDIRLIEGGKVAVDLAIENRYRSGVTSDAQISFQWASIEGAPPKVEAVVIKPGKGGPAEDGAIFALHETLGERLARWSQEAYMKLLGGDIDDDLERFRKLADSAMQAGEAEWTRRKPELEEMAKSIGETLEKAGTESAERIMAEVNKVLEATPER
jgi:hypothetical protein